jgi:hypothetical protein
MREVSESPDKKLSRNLPTSDILATARGRGERDGRRLSGRHEGLWDRYRVQNKQDRETKEIKTTAGWLWGPSRHRNLFQIEIEIEIETETFLSFGACQPEEGDLAPRKLSRGCRGSCAGDV